jgi:arsenate reductase (thioredoxin)
MNISEINQNNFAKAIALLKSNGLPTQDITDATKLFVATEGNNVIGTIGIELYDNLGLLRSLAVNNAYRGKAAGKNLVTFIEAFAKNNDIKELFLLTTTASAFFSRLSYQQIKREDTPPAIKQSTEFTSTCPSSAIVMKKSLKKKVLFVCIENSNRSQMAQAFAKIHGGENIEAYSAGSKPSGKINPKAIAAMKELNYDLSAQASKSLDEVKDYAPFDAVVTMGCGDACPWMPAKKFIDWQIPDPREMNEHDFRKVRDLLESKVKELVHSLESTTTTK